MALNVLISSAIGLTCIIGVSGFEIYSKANMSAAESQILMKMENIREVECILGCKSFGGCAFASFSMINNENYTGSCSYHPRLNLESGLNVTKVVAYTSMSHIGY